MKLHSKLIFSLVACLVVVVTLAQAIQFIITTNHVNNLSKSYLDLLHTREIDHALEIHRSIESSIAGSLKRGEMAKFSRMLEEKKNIEGLDEFSLFSRDGVVTHSSDSHYLNKSIDTAMADKVLSNPDMIVNETEEAIEIYQPQPITWDCVRCHTDWREGDIGGVTYFRFSTAALSQARKDTHHAVNIVKAGTITGAVVTILTVIAVLCAVMYIVLQKLVRRPLGQFGSLLAKFERADGDLTRRITINSKDEIGLLAKLFNSFIARLNGVIHQAQQAAINVGEKASSQASAIEQTSASVREIAQVSQKNADNAGSAKELMRSVSENISEANRTMQELSTAMQELSDDGEKIEDIIKTIETIASQTNLLALNASVEAARAGDAGTSFAVVADEVRQLAMRVSDASQNISDLIGGTIQKIGKDTDLVNTTEKTFIEAANSSGKVAQLVEEIAELSQNQSHGIDEITRAIASIEQSTQQSAAEAEILSNTMAMFKTEAANADRQLASRVKQASLTAHNRTAAGKLSE